ncbi:MAG TPA: CPBP family intramembrane glutamic endopeptidase [Gemmatimonadaceae bacterium]|nr:CPBP family intramembrane glutamic endopeptidase [Gemmatimonadaceae bacterium]
MPNLLDVAFALFFAVGVAGAAVLYFDRELKRRIAAGVPNARLNAYRRATAVQWALAAAAIVIWSRARRPWRDLGLVPPNDWRVYLGVGVMLGVGMLVVRQNRAVYRAKPERLDELAKQIGNVEMILPHNAREFRWFMVLSCTAGVCEELLYRGFLTWLLVAYVGLPAAIVLVAVVFGVAHAYQGPRGMIKTGVVSLIMSLIVLGSGWLIPAMVIHALVDISGGVLGFAVLRRPGAVPAIATT